VLRASERGLGLTWVPLVLVVMSAVYVLSAYPAGWLSDRVPRHWLLGAGIAVLAQADVALASAGGYVMLFAGIALWGLHMGLTQGILASMVTDTAPAEHRSRASVMAGWLWDRFGPATTFWAGAGVAALATFAIAIGRFGRRPPDQRADSRSSSDRLRSTPQR